MLPPLRFLGSEPKFTEPSARPQGAVLCTAVKLVSDPNNLLPPEGAAAPAARLSRFRGPCLQFPARGMSFSVSA